MNIRRLFEQPYREQVLLALLVLAFAIDFWTSAWIILPIVAFLAVLPTIGNAIKAIFERRINIDAFNAVAIVASFATEEFHSAGFIALMLVSARLLDWYTETKTHRAMEELLKLKPLNAVREREGVIEEISAKDIRKGDILLVKQGSRMPVDGVIVHGTSHINEALVTGESALIKKTQGDPVLSSTLVESGLVKIRATRVGKDSTIERMATLIQEASNHKSHSEKLADQFAMRFLPFVGIMGLLTYLVTHNLSMTAAFFLIACADDMSVAIPLAITASLGQAAKRGVIIKGGEWLEALARVKILILDKTGTLTYGSLEIRETQIDPSIDETRFWKMVGMAEKYSEHPIGRAAFHEAVKRVTTISDPDDVRVYKGSGIWIRSGKDEVAVGNEKMLELLGFRAPIAKKSVGAHFFVYLNGAHVGTILMADIPRHEAKGSIQALRDLGIERILMFTGDTPETATEVASALGITEVRASMSPEDKLRELEALIKTGASIAMVGDGINDAPALARANVGIAMGGGGATIAAEAADVIILTDNLERLAEMITLGRRARSIVHSDMGIWFASNIFGFFLVWTGFAGPAIAAFYNFATDFLPLMNSGRLFRKSQAVK